MLIHEQKDLQLLPAIIALLGILILASCEGASFGAREKGALGGGVAGAGLGAIIGHATGHTGEGIAIGAASGAILGGVVGNEVDRNDKRIDETNARLDEQERRLRENEALIQELRRSGADVRETPRGVVINLPDVLFQFDSDRLTNDAYRTVAEISRSLSGLGSRRISVEGHTDSLGTLRYNQELSERRARSVGDELARNGVSRSRIITRGYGESDPIATNSSEHGRQRNRRVEVIVEN